MKNNCELVYRTMTTTATVLRRPPGALSARHLRALAHELAAAVTDLDARMCGGLTPPVAWQHMPPAEPETVESCE